MGHLRCSRLHGGPGTGDDHEDGYISSSALSILMAQANKRYRKNNPQRMLAGITIHDDNVDHIEMVHDEAQRAIRALYRRVLTKRELGKDRRCVGRIVCRAIEHGVVCTVGHGVEHEL
jgi:hypothetical protein